MERALLTVPPLGSLVGGALTSMPLGAIVGYFGASVAVTAAAALVVWGLRLESRDNVDRRAHPAPAA